MKFTVIIPARYGSTRFPGKPLALIAGKPMIQHVYERAIESGANTVIIATDDERIRQVALGFNATVCMTSEAHCSGTSRLAEVIKTHQVDENEIVVNVQGDEPFIPAENIRQVATNLYQNAAVPMATLAYPIDNVRDLFNTNVVKVVANKQKLAMYFSRSTIPYDREQFADIASDSVVFERLKSEYLRHIGIYGYRAGFVTEYNDLRPSLLEQVESLEQLRVLWHGFSIHVDVAKEAPPHGVDTPEDLARLS